MIVRLLAWLVEKLLYIASSVAGIFLFQFFLRLPPSMKAYNERLEFRVLKMEITSSQASQERWNQWMEIFMLTSPIALAGIVGIVLAVWLGQFRRDHAVKRLLKMLKSSAQGRAKRVPKFVLYLRPFSSTNRFVRHKSSINTALSGSFLHAELDTELEREIQRSLSRHGKVVGLGKPGEHVGAAKILSTEASWQEDVKLLVEFANWIVCMPSTQSGTLWETLLIFSTQIYDKTIFLMPPSRAYLRKKNHRIISLFAKSAEGSNEDEKAWDNMQDILRTYNISMPNYREMGAIFYMQTPSDIGFIYEFGPRFEASWSKAVKEATNLRKERKMDLRTSKSDKHVFT